MGGAREPLVCPKRVWEKIERSFALIKMVSYDAKKGGFCLNVVCASGRSNFFLYRKKDQSSVTLASISSRRYYIGVSSSGILEKSTKNKPGMGTFLA